MFTDLSGKADKLLIIEPGRRKGVRPRAGGSDAVGGGGGVEDGELIARLRHADERALEELMRRHWSPLVGYAARMLESADAAQDVAQEVFVRLWQHRTTWDASGSTTSLLYHLAHNIVANRLRHRSVRSRREPEIRRTAPRVPNPFEDAAADELRTAFDRALKSLPPRRREAFVLLRHQSLSLKEAADVMGIAPQTVANHASRATAELRELLRSFWS